MASSVQSTSRCRRLVTDALIDASGVRRSCDTARSSDTRRSSARASRSSLGGPLLGGHPLADGRLLERFDLRSATEGSRPHGPMPGARGSSRAHRRRGRHRGPSAFSASRDREPVERRGEEPVGAQEAAHRRGGRRSDPADRCRDDDHEQQVEEQIAREAEGVAQVGEHQRQQRDADERRSASRSAGVVARRSGSRRRRRRQRGPARVRLAVDADHVHVDALGPRGARR